jgi:serine protease Do
MHPNKHNFILYILVTVFMVVAIFVSCTAAAPVSVPTVSQQSAPADNQQYVIPVSSDTNPVLPDFVSVLNKVKPSVVAINDEMTTYDMFNRPQTAQAAGSGWILDTEGHVVTNNHVIQDAKNITVTLSNGKTYPATVIGADSLTDLAILKINADNLTSIAIGDTSKSQVGDWVLTVGNSLGLGITAKEGIISRMGVSLQETPSETLDNLIETSAAINPGNSGGPLVSMRGEIIGINSIKIAESGVEGMGYAINVASAIPVLSQLLQTGYIVRPWMGVSSMDVNPFVQAYYGLSVRSGALITSVAKNSPASQAGIVQGDIITGFNNTEIKSASDLVTAILSAKIGDKVTLTYLHNSTKKTIDIVLGKSPSQQ